MAKSLFPPILGKGSKGAAVISLQNFLRKTGFGNRIKPKEEGEYGDETVAAVRALQRSLCCGENGCFDQPTRELVKEQMRFDVDAIPADTYPNITYFVGPDGEEKWNPTAKDPADSCVTFS